MMKKVELVSQTWILVGAALVFLYALGGFASLPAVLVVSVALAPLYLLIVAGAVLGFVAIVADLFDRFGGPRV